MAQIDPSIALSFRPVELPNALAQYAQAMQIQSSQNQNALAQYQLSRAQRDDETQTNMLADLRSANGDQVAIRNALIRAGKPEAAFKLETDRANLGKTIAETGKITNEQLAGKAAALYQNPTDEAIVAMAMDHKQRTGEDVTPFARELLSAPTKEARQAILQRQALSHPEGRQALELMQPKGAPVNVGNAVVFPNQNALAGPLGAQTQPALPMSMTPGERATDTRDRAKMAYEGIGVGGASGVGRPTASPANYTAPDHPQLAGGGLSPKSQQEVALTFQKKRAEAAGDYSKSLDERVAQAADLNMRTQEINEALQNIKTGGGQEAYAKLAQYAQAVPGMPKGIVDRIAGGDLAAAQEFQKLQVTNAMEQLRLAMGGTGRITQSEFAAFQQANPNLNLDPNAIQKILNFTTRMYRVSRDEQQAFGKWMGDGRNPADFRANWDQQMEAKGYTQPNLQATPKGADSPTKPKLGEVRRGYLFKGGDPANASSWERVSQ